MVCGAADAVLVPATNWSRADIFKTANFAHAVVRPGDTAAKRTNLPGTIISHHPSSMRQGPEVRDDFVVQGKDLQGNCWVTGILLPRAWAKIDEDLKSLGVPELKD